MVDSRGAFKTTGGADQRNAGVRNWIKDTLAIFAVAAERGLVVDGALATDFVAATSPDTARHRSPRIDPIFAPQRKTASCQ